MEDLRLRGLAGGVAEPQPEPLQAWPSDAATPPRGVPPRATQHATRRSAALDRQLGNDRLGNDRPGNDRSGNDRGANQDDGSGRRRDESRRSGYGPPAPGYDDRSASEHPEAGRPSNYADSGRPAPGRFPDLSRPPASYNNPGYSDSSFPDLGQSGAAGGGAYPGRPRGNHGRPRGGTAPNTSEMPSGRSGARSPRRKVSIPLAALLVLIIVVLLGSLWASHRNADSDSSSMQGSQLSTALTLVPVPVDGG
jgi:hypothetical protein